LPDKRHGLPAKEEPVGRRQIPRQPEVKVAVRVAVAQPAWFEATAVATLALLASAMAGVWWMAAAQLPK
jgi:hypothetical protein